MDMTNTTKTDARIYSGITRHNGRYWVRGDYMRSITNVRLLKVGGVFGNQVEVTHSNGHVHVIKQLDRNCFFIDGPDYDGECDGFNDGVRLLNGM